MHIFFFCFGRASNESKVNRYRSHSLTSFSVCEAFSIFEKVFLFVYVVCCFVDVRTFESVTTTTTSTATMATVSTMCITVKT